MIKIYACHLKGNGRYAEIGRNQIMIPVHVLFVVSSDIRIVRTGLVITNCILYCN